MAEIEGKGSEMIATTRVVHYQTSSSEVACGAPMRHWQDEPDGWDLGTITVALHDVTCDACRAALKRAEAREHEQRREESWARSDTDGFLSQWASGLNASKARMEADLLEAGGTTTFPGLFDVETGERLKAKIVYVASGYAYGRKVATWIVLDENDRALAWVPAYKSGKRSKLYRLGLEERDEVAPARVEFVGSSAVNVSPVFRRTDGGYPENASIWRKGSK